MKPESQAILREFNRRLRSALREAPNHVRVEAALEVESHVLDVLNRSGGKEPEAELVSRVLSGFGTPEQYAQALLSQLPGQEAVTVGNGLKDVGLAASDLFRGARRLLTAVLIGTARVLWRCARSAWTSLVRAVTWVRGPAGRTARWFRINLVAAAYGLRRMTRRLVRWGGQSAGQLGHVGRAGGEALLRLARRLTAVASTLITFVFRTLRWALRAAGMAALAGLALLFLGIAGFSALAPDITGWIARGIAFEVGLSLEELRRKTTAQFYLGQQADLAQTGIVILGITLALGAGLITLLVYLGWNARRRRGAPAGH